MFFQEVTRELTTVFTICLGVYTVTSIPFLRVKEKNSVLPFFISIRRLAPDSGSSKGVLRSIAGASFSVVYATVQSVART
ncbi:hypothetical protein CK934_16810 [Chitinophaga sp. MD30]|nr:hypothetical protein CK934_16810 [Chitinophaga sp. MD30]